MQRSNTNTIPSTTSIALYAITSHIILYEMASIKYIDYEKNMIFNLGLPGKARRMLNFVFHTIRYIVIYISAAGVDSWRKPFETDVIYLRLMCFYKK